MSSSIQSAHFFLNQMSIYQNQVDQTSVYGIEARKSLLEQSSGFTKGYLTGSGYNPSDLRISIAGIYQNVVKPALERDPCSIQCLGVYQSDYADLRVFYVEEENSLKETCSQCSEKLGYPLCIEIYNDDKKITLDTVDFHGIIDHDWCVLKEHQWKAFPGIHRILEPIALAQFIVAANKKHLDKVETAQQSYKK